MKIKQKYPSARERIRRKYPELFEPGTNEIGINKDYINDIRSPEIRAVSSDLLQCVEQRSILQTESFRSNGFNAG